MGKVLPFEPPSRVPTELSDEALLRACGDGEMAALASLFDRHASAMFAFLMRLTRNRSATEDLVQDAFLAAFQNAKKFHRRSKVRTWLFGIAANLAGKDFRSQQRRVAREAAFVVAATPNRELPDTRLRKADLRAALQSAVADLSHVERVAYTICDVEGVAGKEAAIALGVRPGTLYRRLHDARTKLRVALDHFRGDA